MPCCVCRKQFTHTEASHVRTAFNSGIATKPSDDYLIPACKNCHSIQHQHGHAEALFKIRGDVYTKQQAKDWYLAQAEKHEKWWNLTKGIL